MSARQKEIFQRNESLLIGAAALLLFMFGTWDQPFVNFESRFAVFMQEALRNGLSVFPTSYGENYPDYPATAFWPSYFIALFLGHVNKFSAVLPSAIAAACTVVLTYKILEPTSKIWARMAVCFELLTPFFVAEARSISLDQMVAAITAWSFYLVYSAGIGNRRAPIYYLPLLLILGFAIRGPIGLVIPAGVVTIYYALNRQWRTLFIFGLLAAATLLCSVCALLALAHVSGGAEFVRDVIHMQVVGRMNDAAPTGFFYYFTSSIGNYALVYPVALIALVLIAVQAYTKSISDDAVPLLLFLSGWAMVVMIGLSIPETKKIRYILSAIPPISAIAAYVFIDGSNKAAQVFSKFLLFVFTFLPFFLLLGLFFAHQQAAKKHPEIQVAWLGIVIALFFIQVLAGIVAIKVNSREWRAPALAALAALSLWWVNVFCVGPFNIALRDNRPFVLQVEEIRKQNMAPLAFYRITKDGAAIKYIVHLNHDVKPLFFENLAQIKNAEKPLYLLMLETTYKQAGNLYALSDKPILRGTFEGEAILLFYVP